MEKYSSNIAALDLRRSVTYFANSSLGPSATVQPLSSLSKAIKASSNSGAGV